MQLRKTVLISLILLGGTTVWVSRQLQLAQAQVTLVKTKSKQADCNQRIAAAEEELEKTQRELQAQTQQRIHAQSDVAKIESQLAKADPESYWSKPPDSLPDWNSDSPVIWLRKELLPDLPLGIFGKQGELNPEVADLLTLDEAQERDLNASLRKILDDYHALELAKVERVKEHLLGIGQEKGDKMTIRVMPLLEEGKQFKQSFETALRNSLGEQRSDLVIRGSANWLDSQFSSEGTEPKTITVVRHENGTYGIATKSGGNWFNTSGFKDISYYVPSHLLPLFKDLLEKHPQKK